MNAFTPIRPAPLLCTQTFAELVTLYNEAENEIQTAWAVLAVHFDDQTEHARCDAAEERRYAVEQELRTRLASHVGGKDVLARITEICL